MGLGQFVKPDNQIMHDTLRARDVATSKTPMLVYVREFKTGLKTEFNKDGTGEGVAVDLVDLSTFQSNPEGSVYCNVLWMSKAVADQLRPCAGGDPVAIRLAWAAGGSFGQYVVPEPIEDDWLQWAQYIVTNYPEFVNQVKAKRLAAWQAEHPDAPAQAAPAPQAAPALPSVVAASPAPQAAPPAPPAPAPQAVAAVPPAGGAASPGAVAAPIGRPPVAPPAFSPAPAAAPPAPPQVPASVPAAAAPPAPPQAPAVAAAAPGQVGDPEVERMLAELNATG